MSLLVPSPSPSTLAAASRLTPLLVAPAGAVDFDDAGTAEMAGGTPTTLPATLPETLPATLLAALFARLRGVSGGVAADVVVIMGGTGMGFWVAKPAGTLWMLLGDAAARLGTVPRTRVGLLTTDEPLPDAATPVAGTGMVDACVTMDDVELDRVGEDGRLLAKEAVGGGDGAVNELAEFRCWWWCTPLPVYGDGGAKTDVGVGTGVF